MVSFPLQALPLQHFFPIMQRLMLVDLMQQLHIQLFLKVIPIHIARPVQILLEKTRSLDSGMLRVYHGIRRDTTHKFYDVK